VAHTLKLTKTAVAKANYSGAGSQRVVIWDSALSGFGLRVYPTGRKAYVLSYRHHGRKRLMVIGSPSELSVQDAREKAARKKVDLSDGIDPLTEKNKRNKTDLFENFADAYLADYASQKKSVRDDKSMIKKLIKPVFGAIPLKDIQREDIAKLHRKIGRQINKRTDKPKIYRANRVLALLSKMFEFAITEGYLPETHPNPAKRIKKFPEESRDTWIAPEQLPRLAEALDKEQNTVARDAIWLYLLTGLRKSELLKLHWSDIDFNRNEIRLPDTKNGRRHYLPLSAEALTKLNSMPRIVDNPYVLPGAIDGRHLVNIDKPWQRIRKAADLKHVRLHDLRRTLGSWLASSGNSLHLIGRVLNHSNTSTTQIYARFGQDTVRTALDQHGKQIMGAARKTKPAPVEDLRKTTGAK